MATRSCTARPWISRLRSNNTHDEYALVQGHALVQGLVVATLGVLYGSEHEDHALVVEARGSGSLPASPRATAAVRLPTEPGRDERRKGCAVGRRGTVLAWCVLARPGPWLVERLVAAADAFRRSSPVTTVSTAGWQARRRADSASCLQVRHARGANGRRGRASEFRVESDCSFSASRSSSTTVSSANSSRPASVGRGRASAGVLPVNTVCVAGLCAAVRQHAPLASA